MEITKDILRPVLSYLRSLGLVIFIYIDDGLQLNKNEELLKIETNFVLTVLKLLGWKVNFEKSELEPQQRLLVQGFIIDTVRMKYFYPDWKQQRLENQIRDILQKGRKKKWPTKELASVYGRVSTAARAYGKLGSFIRHGQHKLGQVVMNYGTLSEPNWNSWIQLDEQALNELEEVLRFILKGSGCRIQNSEKGCTIKASGFTLRTDWLPELAERDHHHSCVRCIR